jgi:hypothetical protein
MAAMHMNFDLDYDSQGLSRPETRELTGQEKEWINSILQSNKGWADVTIGDIRVDGACTCGCRTVHLERPLQPQNARAADLRVENVGMMWLITDLGKSIGIGLHAKYGSLGELGVVYQENAEPWPAAWKEVSRRILS